MTKEEFLSLPFERGGHFSGGGEHVSTEVNREYGFYKHHITRVSRDGFTFGKTRIHYEYKGKEYNKLEKFLEAIKDVEFKDKEETK